MADATPILHIVSPLRHVSPFDVNMAVDAGFPAIASYTNVDLDEVVALAQDAMFSRPPDYAVQTGMFFGGKDAILAIDMLEAAKSALFPPFEISLFADPSGSFTTAAAMIAMVEAAARKERRGGLKGLQVQVYGATGVVGGIGAVLSAQAGADVVLVSHRDIESVQKKAAEFKERFGVEMRSAQATDDAGKRRILPEAHVVLAAGKAGIQILDEGQLTVAENLIVAADVNAVPPTGLAGVDADSDGVPLPGGGVGIGALTIGGLKYRVQHELLKRMRTSDKAVCLSFEDAFELARNLHT